MRTWKVQNSRAVEAIVRQRSAAGRIRRVGDVLIACILLAITLPLLLVIALAVKVDSPGPVLDEQTCVGLGGRRFQMLQFRTVVYDARYFVPPWAREPTGMAQFLRATRIEVLPQLINVLRGEMGIIDREAGSPSFFG
jgi:lipopolysaccharide/colanic/teichoic acid biosynthesis glycosyltransferase